jgi:hypothetical protein
MRDGGRIIRLMAREGLFMRMEISMMGIGRMIKLMDSEYTVIWMELGTRGTGKKINNMEKDWKHGLMVPATKEIM